MIKTIVADNMEDFDKLVNDFEKQPENSVFATQTHVDRKDNMRTLFVAVIFYKVRI